MYGSQNLPYLTQQPPYLTQQPPYPTQQPPYPAQQPPYCVPPTYDEAVSGKTYQASSRPHQAPSQPYQASVPPQAPYQSFPPEHTISVCPRHHNDLQPCECCPHNPPTRQYPIVVQQEVRTSTQHPAKCVRIFFILLVIVFLAIFVGTFVRMITNINRHN